MQLRLSAAALAVTLGAIGFGCLPGVAHAGGVEKDPCRDLPDGRNSDGRLVCGPLQFLTLGGGTWLPFYLEHTNDDELPDGYFLECPSGSRIPGTDYWSSAFSYNWEWNYWAEDDYTEWAGNVPYAWPGDGVLPGGAPGYYATNVAMMNWRWPSDETTDVRVFWSCEPVNPGRAASGPPADPPHGGGAGDDRLRGGEGDNAVVGFAGDDRLHGRAGEDHLHGGAGKDTLLGGVHDDLIHGRRAADTALGGSGDDSILTGKGDDIARGGKDGDRLFDNEGSDVLRGGRGNDRFSAFDGDRDVIRCGAGEDIALIDRQDVAIECEHAFRSARETPRQLPKI